MVKGDSYEEQLRALEAQLSPRPRRVVPYLFRTAKRGLPGAAKAADDHADALDRLEPPTDAEVGHREYVAALRAVARDARQLAEQKRRHGRALVQDLRALPSYQTMVDTRERLLNGRRSED